MKKTKQKVRKWLHDIAFYRNASKRQRVNRPVIRNLDLNGKKAAVFGVATDKSIAWNIAKTLNDNGCRIALGFQDRASEYVQELAKELSQPFLLSCDMVEDEQIASFFNQLESEFGSIDILIHSVAFAKKDFLQGKYFEITRKGYNTAQEVSAFSLAALVQAGERILNPGGTVLTMSYLGSEKAVQNYNIMGVCKAALESSVRYLATDLGERKITVNAISAGPVKTLAASGISGFDRVINLVEARSPLKRNIVHQDIGDLALFLCSDLARNITGQVIYVDAGFSIVGI
jgi:enoyl-[acyl-carrier protein] reductase I